jgi:hypothetical protein
VPLLPDRLWLAGRFSLLRAYGLQLLYAQLPLSHAVAPVHGQHAQPLTGRPQRQHGLFRHAVLQGVPYQLAVTNGGNSIQSVWIDYNGNGNYQNNEWTQVEDGTEGRVVPIRSSKIGRRKQYSTFGRNPRIQRAAQLVPSYSHSSNQQTTHQDHHWKTHSETRWKKLSMKHSDV